ncbi:MAG: citrate synthase [Thaumarchaeota archaeon]|nr:citrate synthase [Nitrososphaerota archaeon]
MSEPMRVPKGLYGVAVSETSIAKSESEGSLTYRGYDIADLFENASFEETAYLVLKGKLPGKTELDQFTSSLRQMMKVPQSIYQMVRSLPPSAHPIDVLRTAVSALGALEAAGSSEERQLSLIAKMPTLVANCYRITKKLDAVEPDVGGGLAANLLYMLTKQNPSKFETWAFERELILYMEHDLNASSFTVRVVASTQADAYAAATAGLAALKGPLHGGANEVAMQMLLSIGEPGKARGYVSDALSQGKKIPGFGHRVYKKVTSLYKLSTEVESAVWEFKKLPANLDFYAAPIFYVLGIPIEVYTPIFAASRIVGWMAHYNEQIAENKIIRPDAIYVGPKSMNYLPVSKR